MESENITRLNRIFRELFGLDTVSETMGREDIPGWNSMQTINLILVLEETFQIEVTPEEAVTMTGVSQVKTLLASKGVVF